MDQHGSLHPDLYARVESDRPGHELVASAYDYPVGKYHRARADIAQLTSWDEVRHSFSRVRTRKLRDDRFESPRHHARVSRLRMVRHSSLDRRRGRPHVDSRGVARMADSARRQDSNPCGCGGTLADRIHFVPDLLAA